MIVTNKTNSLNNCSCGNKIDHYSMGYGSTPYDIHCTSCKKNTNLSTIEVTGSDVNIIDFWNSHISIMNIDDIKLENEALNSKKKKELIKNEWKYYNFFWIKDKGITISKGY